MDHEVPLFPLGSLLLMFVFCYHPSVKALEGHLQNSHPFLLFIIFNRSNKSGTAKQNFPEGLSHYKESEHLK